MKTPKILLPILAIGSTPFALSANFEITPLELVPSPPTGLHSYTTPGGEVTVSAFTTGGAAGNFAANNGQTIMGVEGGQRTNVLDNDTDEAIELDFNNGYGLGEIQFQWYAVTLEISGFTEDPLASGNHGNGTPIADIAYSGGTLTLPLPYDGAYWGDSATVDFANLDASIDGSLTIMATDEGSRTSINSFTAVPEPGLTAVAAGMAALLGLALYRRRR